MHGCALCKTGHEQKVYSGCIIVVTGYWILMTVEQIEEIEAQKWQILLGVSQQLADYADLCDKQAPTTAIETFAAVPGTQRSYIYIYICV